MRSFLAVLLFLAQQYALAQDAMPPADCPALSNSSCRATPPNGKLRHGLVWTTSCGPVTMKSTPDKFCRELAKCPSAGGFGHFLQAVTSNCTEKHFDGYFGLDGLTFGILDWTQDNLATVLQAYQRRNKDRFEQIFGTVRMPMNNGCIDATWICESNKQGYLNCDPTFRAAFTKGLQESDFKMAQVDVAFDTYSKRIARYSSLALKSEYGNVAMAVVGNNLAPRSECKPAAWKAACAGQANETDLVNCMLDQYVMHRCRGSRDGAAERRRVSEIKRVYSDKESTPLIRASKTDVHSCAVKAME